MGKTDNKQDGKLSEKDAGIKKDVIGTNQDDNSANYREEEWMIRPCDMYHREFKDCKSIISRFHQYFVNGENTLCKQWKIDYENCKKWKKKNDDHTYNNLLESEKQRRLQRLRGNVGNDVWEHRNQPPSDWNDPLPEWLQKRNEGTFLAMKQKEINEKGFDDEKDLYIPSCVIS